MDFRVADGLEGLRPGETDALVMAGMGGLVMGRILQEGATVAAAARRILLQPQGNLPELRAFLYENGYCVQDEAIVLDNGRYYQLILAAKGAPAPLPPGWPPGYWELGPVAFAKGEPLLLPLAKNTAPAIKAAGQGPEKGYTPQALAGRLPGPGYHHRKLEEPHAAM